VEKNIHFMLIHQTVVPAYSVGMGY